MALFYRMSQTGVTSHSGIRAIAFALFMFPSIALSSTTTYETAYVEAQNIRNALRLFYLDSGSLPASEVGIEALIVAPADADGWRGPYLDRIPKDPWGNDYVYGNLGDTAETIQVYSKGRDGRDDLGLGDDISSLHGYKRSIYMTFWQRNGPIAIGLALIVLLSGIVLAVARFFIGRRTPA
ncbi:MAG: type II secretion system protein GspG [Pseudomonadota bacterium]